MRQSFIPILLTAFILTSTAYASSKLCSVPGFYLKITKGNISCKEAKRIYKIYTSNQHLPKGWMCAASAKTCFNDKLKVSFDFVLKK